MVKLTQSKSPLVDARPFLSPPARTEQERDQLRYAARPSRGWYGLARWRKQIVPAIKARDGMQCQQTGVMLVGAKNQPNSAVVDHKLPHNDDPALFWGMWNLQLVSKSWHDGQKQREERAGLHNPATASEGGEGQK